MVNNFYFIIYIRVEGHICYIQHIYVLKICLLYRFTMYILTYSYGMLLYRKIDHEVQGYRCTSYRFIVQTNLFDFCLLLWRFLLDSCQLPVSKSSPVLLFPERTSYLLSPVIKSSFFLFVCHRKKGDIFIVQLVHRRLVCIFFTEDTISGIIIVYEYGLNHPYSTVFLI